MAKLDLLLKRIQEVLAAGTFPSASAWCKAAGLSRSYIGALRNRGGTAGTGEVRNVKHEEIARLARAASVEVDWLMGNDSVRSAGPEGLERALMQFDWPDMLTAMQAKAVQARARAEAAAVEEDDLPISFWLKRLGRLAAEVHNGRSTQPRKSR